MFQVWFDRRLAPDTVHRGSVRVESGGVPLLLSMHVDPIESSIVAVPLAGGALEPNVLYRLTVADVRSLEGIPLEEPVTITFSTGTEEGEAPAPEKPTFASVEGIFGAHCVGHGCHGPDAPALGLDLSSAEGVRRTAIGQPAEQTRVGAAGAEGVTVGRGLAGMPRIDVLAATGRPARSYLLYKMLGDPLILGDPMPRLGAGDAASLDEEDLRAIGAWILGGAPTD